MANDERDMRQHDSGKKRRVPAQGQARRADDRAPNGERPQRAASTDGAPTGRRVRLVKRIVRKRADGTVVEVITVPIDGRGPLKRGAVKTSSRPSGTPQVAERTSTSQEEATRIARRRRAQALSAREARARHAEAEDGKAAADQGMVLGPNARRDASRSVVLPTPEFVPVTPESEPEPVLEPEPEPESQAASPEQTPHEVPSQPYRKQLESIPLITSDDVRPGESEPELEPEPQPESLAPSAREFEPLPRTRRQGKAGATQVQPLAQDRRPRVFWKAYAALVVVIVVLIGVVLAHTYDSLVRYEVSQPEVFMDRFVEDLAANGSAAARRKQQCLDGLELGTNETAEFLAARFDQGLGHDEYRVEHAGAVFDVNAPSYTIYADDEPFLSVHLEPKSTYVRLGLLTITDWGIDNVILHTPDMPAEAAEQLGEGLSYDISVAENSTVTVDGTELSEQALADSASVLPAFEYAAEFVDPPEAVTYHLTGLHTEPEVEVRDYEGEEVELSKRDFSIAAASLFVPNRTAAQLPVNVLTVAETWSRLMTADLYGDNHGLAQVTSFLIPGSELYEYASNFVQSIDITFVWAHTLTGFTEESVTNCVMYNDSLFSCDVRFVKNMVLASGELRTDEFNNTMIFAYISDGTVAWPGWYLVNMQAIT